MREDVDEAQALWSQPRGDPSEQLLVVLHVLRKARPRISIAKVRSKHVLVVAHDLWNQYRIAVSHIKCAESAELEQIQVAKQQLLKVQSALRTGAEGQLSQNAFKRR